jgi:hypothetical protein
MKVSMSLTFSVCFKNKPKSIIKYKINCISDRILTTASVLTLMLRLRKFQIKKKKGSLLYPREEIIISFLTRDTYGGMYIYTMCRYMSKTI